MNQKNKSWLFYSLIIIFIALSIFFTYRRAFITKDFEIIQPEYPHEVTKVIESSTTEGFEVSSTTVPTTNN